MGALVGSMAAFVCKMGRLGGGVADVVVVVVLVVSLLAFERCSLLCVSELRLVFCRTMRKKSSGVRQSECCC